MFDELTDAEWAVLDMLAKSGRPWVRRSLAVLVAGEAVVDRLVSLKLVECWRATAVDERRRELSGDWRPTRGYPTTLAALTSLGHTATGRDVFERTDMGQPVQGHRLSGRDRVLRRKATAGGWVLPDSPIRSLGSSRVELYDEIAPDQPEAPKGKRKGRRAG